MRAARLGAGLALGALVLSSCSSDPADPVTDGPDARAEPTVETAVYFVGETPSGPRLFAELRDVPEADPVNGAIDLLLAGQPQDPDYTSAIPVVDGAPGQVEYSDSEEIGSVDFGDLDWGQRVEGMDARQSKLAVAAFALTMGEAGAFNSSFFTGFGVSGSQLFGRSLNGVSTNPARNRSVGLLNVTSPREGEVVNGTVAASGLANAFEATVLWRVSRDGDVVEDGFATARRAGRLSPWSVEIDVSGYEPGTYVFDASTEDVGEGPPPTVDGKTFVIE